MTNNQNIQNSEIKAKDNHNTKAESTSSKSNKCYVLDMFPYPSGEGLHVGHPKGYIATDIYSRYKKMNGFEVIHPMGWDAFGLPAEQYAIKNKIHPRIAVEKNIANFKSQLNKINFDYDWDREISTTDPKFYKWTQWIFKQLYKKGLAFESYEPINWCPSCKTGLANEDLEGNACERCGSIVEKKPLRQWNLAITKYADRLIDDLDTLEKWPEWVKTAQKNWIGRSEGSEIDFVVKADYERASFLIVEKSLNEQHIRLLDQFGEVKVEEVDEDWGRFFRVFIEKNKERNFENFLKENLRTDNGKWYADSMSTSNKVIFNGKIFEIKDQKSFNEYIEYGKSIGVPVEQLDVQFENNFKFTIFTTRADTLFGCTYTVLAPEHELVKEILEKNIIQNKEEVLKYIEEVKLKTDIERSAEGREKTGVRLEGVVAINPANQKEVPVYIADYVLASYGTGAIMAVPAHDERDFEFAKKYNIQTIDVIAKHFVLSGHDAEREDVETLNRIVVDPIIRDKDNNFYFVKEPQDNAIHFAGGGVDDGETDIEAMRREIKEELGFVDFEVVRNIKPNISVWGYRYTKNKNQRTVGTNYEVVLNSLERVSSEIEEGKHELVSFKKEDALKSITWEHHRYIFEQYLKDSQIFTEEGILINSENFNGLTSEKARIKITEAVGGKLVKKYKLREWVFARQRYWGEPFPVVYATDEKGERDMNAKPIMVADSELPVLLPEVESYEPTGTGESPLANIKEFTDVYGFINEDGEFESVKNYFKFEDKFKDEILFNKKLNTIRLETKNINIGNIISLKLKSDASTFAYAKVENIKEEDLKDLDINNTNGTSYSSKQDQLSSYRKYYGDNVNLETKFYIISFTLVNTDIKLFKRETNTMPQWAGSSWYYLRFLDPHNDKFMIDPSVEKEWPQVDVYVGGDHATRHLIYARFWHKFLYDIGVVSNIEPFKRLEFLGFILAEDGTKMSKSKGNVINPNDIVAEYGSDTFRMYEMFMAPFEATAVWSTSSIKGVKRFVDRVERLGDTFVEAIKNNDQGVLGRSCENINIIHQTIKKVSEDIEGFKFNTAVSQLMICLNEFEGRGVSLEEYTSFVKILTPFAPNVFQKFENKLNIDRVWPQYDEAKLAADFIKIAVQVNGKLREVVEVKSGAKEEECLQLVKSKESVNKYLVDGIKKVVFVPNKIINIIV